MGSAFRTIGRSFRDWWDEMFLMVGINLVWALLALPVVTLFPATMGAMNVAYDKVRGRRVEFDLFWKGFRRYFGKSWALGAINTIVTILIIVNIVFYLQQPSWLFYLTIIWIYALLIWMGVIIYVFPLAIEQDDKSVKLIYRNAALLALGRPVFTLVIAIVQLLLLAASIILSPLLLLVYIPLSSLISNHALLISLEEVETRRSRLAARQAEEEKDETEPE
ncbi:MAG: DUF624 domain-containing protein [Anaerolineae bacterium]